MGLPRVEAYKEDAAALDGTGWMSMV